MCLTSDRNRFLLENGGLFEDVPRSVDGAALIADPRNDGNLIISGLQAALLKFQNSVMDLVEAGSLRDQAAFAEAQRLVRWHWRWLIVHEFLPQFVGQAMIDDVLERGRRVFTDQQQGRIPVEFQTSAYRFGHSMIRPSYRANLAGDGEVKPNERIDTRISTSLFQLPLMAIGAHVANRLDPYRSAIESCHDVHN